MSPTSESMTYNTYTKSVFAVLDENVPNPSVTIKKPDKIQHIINIKVQSLKSQSKLKKKYYLSTSLSRTSFGKFPIKTLHPSRDGIFSHEIESLKLQQGFI